MKTFQSKKFWCKNYKKHRLWNLSIISYRHTLNVKCVQKNIANPSQIFAHFLQNVNAIEVSVPVGNVEHTTYVVGLTTFLVSGSTIYLLVTLFRSHETSHMHVD